MINSSDLHKSIENSQKNNKIVTHQNKKKINKSITIKDEYEEDQLNNNVYDDQYIQQFDDNPESQQSYQDEKASFYNEFQYDQFSHEHIKQNDSLSYSQSKGYNQLLNVQKSNNQNQIETDNSQKQQNGDQLNNQFQKSSIINKIEYPLKSSQISNKHHQQRTEQKSSQDKSFIQNNINQVENNNKTQQENNIENQRLSSQENVEQNNSQINQFKNVSRINKKQDTQESYQSQEQVEHGIQNKSMFQNQSEKQYNQYNDVQQNLFKNNENQRNKKSNFESQQYDQNQIFKETDVIPQKINLTFEQFMNQQSNMLQNSQNTKINENQEEQNILINKQSQIYGQDQQNPQLNLTNKSQDIKQSIQFQINSDQGTLNNLREDNTLDQDQKTTFYEQSERTNHNLTFDNQTFQDEDLRVDFENGKNMKSQIGHKQSTKKTMISDQSLKIDLILNHQPTINPDNYRYNENKEKFQIFFKKNAEKIMKQIQKQGQYQTSSNEYVIKFQEFHSFIEKLFNNDNFTLLESESNLQDILKNKNINLILSTILQEFLKIVRKVNEKIVIDDKNYEIGIEDMMDFFEFWIRVDEQIIVRYDMNPQQQQIDLVKSGALQSSPQLKPLAPNKENQIDPINTQNTQSRLQSLLEGNIQKLENLQRESVSNNIEQSSLINQTLQFLKQQYKKFEKKTLEEQQIEKVQLNMNDQEVSQIQQQIINIFKEYSSYFAQSSRKQTFDEIQKQQYYMNINNFFRFVKDYSLQNEKIQGAQIIEVFNRNCTGKQMNYSQYYTSLLRISEIRENCVFVEQKTQMITIAKMLKLKIQINNKENNNNKVKKHAIEIGQNNNGIRSQARSLSPQNINSLSTKPQNELLENQQGKLNWNEVEKLSYQQINNFGNKKSSSPSGQNESRENKKVNDKLNNQGEQLIKKIKNTGDDFNPNDLIDFDDEANEILDKQYRITKQVINEKISISEKEQIIETKRFPRIVNPEFSEQNSKLVSELDSQKDSITNVRMIKQIKSLPKTSSASPPHNNNLNQSPQNILKQPRINRNLGYSKQYKIANPFPNSVKKVSNSPSPRIPIPPPQGLQQKNKIQLVVESAEKDKTPRYSVERNQHGNLQQQQLFNNQQLNQMSGEPAIQDAIKKSTQFRNFLKDRAIYVSNDSIRLKAMQSGIDVNSPIKAAGLGLVESQQQFKMMNMSEFPQSFPPYSHQINYQQQIQHQQNLMSKNFNSQNQQQSQQAQSPKQINSYINQNMNGGQYSFGKNQNSINQFNKNEQKSPSTQIQRRGSHLHDNYLNNSVRVIPVMNNQQFNQDKM